MLGTGGSCTHILSVPELTPCQDGADSQLGGMRLSPMATAKDLEMLSLSSRVLYLWVLCVLEG